MKTLPRHLWISSTLALAAFALFGGECAALLAFRNNEGKVRNETARLHAETHALGSAAAPRESLEAALADFREKNGSNGESAPDEMETAALALELSGLFRQSGMSADASLAAAREAAEIPGAAPLVRALSADDGTAFLALSRTEEAGWQMRLSSTRRALPEVLDAFARNGPESRLFSLSVRRSADGPLEIEAAFAQVRKKGAK